MTPSTQSPLESYRRMRLRHLPILAIDIRQIPIDLGEPCQSLYLELLREHCSGKIALKFTAVQDLKIERIHPGTVCHLEIDSVAEDQLEGLRFRVSNDEQDFVLSFYCSDFEINELPLS